MRFQSAKALGQLKAEATVEHLIALLKDRYSYVRASAAEALEQLLKADDED